MTDSEYHALADELWNRVEDIIDESDVDIECETHGGVMYLNFENGTQIVVNRQEPLHQVWVATKKAGYHFENKDALWICNRSGVEIYALLSEACTDQAGETIQFQA